MESALADAQTIVNVGAGTGSYEPDRRYVVAVEPSQTIRRQRLSAGRPPAVAAAVESLPFDDDAFDAAMAIITIHHWTDAERGLGELRRVARERRHYPTVQRITAVLDAGETVEAASGSWRIDRLETRPGPGNGRRKPERPHGPYRHGFSFDNA